MHFHDVKRDQIDWSIPVLTLDVNQVALKESNLRDPNMAGLVLLEWNYFVEKKLELCVTPETQFEINKDGFNSNKMGWNAYNRFQKSQLFKSRPERVRLNLSDQVSNEYWRNIRYILFPTVSDKSLTVNQCSDVSQLFYHIVASGQISNSAFLTLDKNFSKNAGLINREFGVKILSPSDCWEEFQQPYNLHEPTTAESHYLFQDQQRYFEELRLEANKI